MSTLVRSHGKTLRQSVEDVLVLWRRIFIRVVERLIFLIVLTHAISYFNHALMH